MQSEESLFGMGHEGAGAAPVTSAARRNDRLMILVLAGATLAMMAVVWWYYDSQKRAMEAAVSTELFLVSEVQAKQVAYWRRERLADGRVVASPLLLGIAKRVLAGTSSGADLELFTDTLTRMAREYDYRDVSLVGLDGSAYIRLKEKVTDESRLRKTARERLAKKAVDAQDVGLSDISLETRDGQPMMFLTVPIAQSGALIFDIDPARFLYPYLEAQRGARSTGESLLVLREGNEIVFISNRRFAANGVSFYRRTLTDLKIPSTAILEAGWKVQAKDYRGVDCIVVARRIPESPWYLVVKVDAAEVDAPIGRLAWQVAFVTVLIGLAGVVCLVLIIKDQRERVRREKDAYLFAVVNDTPALLWMAGKDGAVTFINRALAGFLGTAQKPLASDWPSWLHADDAPGVREKFLECLAARRGFFDEFRLRRHNGEFRWVIDEGSPRYSTEGEFVGYTGCMLDITERRRAELQLRAVNERLQTLSSRLLVAEEEGRKRVARELHDDLSQQIAALSIAVGSLKRKLPAEQVEGRDRSDRIHLKLVQLAESVRRLSHELHPAVLQYSGLAAALREHVSEFAAASGIAASLVTDGPLDDVPPAVSLCIYRITQEALRNIGKHAQASVATVALRVVDGAIELGITDNGVGIEMPASGTFAGLGLVSMEERARLAGGKLTLRTKPGEGTNLQVRIPLAVAENQVHT